MVIAQNLGHVKDGAAPSDTPHNSVPCHLQRMICHPFEDSQIVELVGVVLVVVGTPLPTMKGLSLRMGAFSERGTLSKSSKRLCSWTSLKKLCSRRWLINSLPPTVSRR